MRIDDAIKRAETLVPTLEGTDAAAITSLINVAKRVRRFQEPIRQLERVLCTELNQTELFPSRSDE